MKILHTSDMHLCNERRETLEALKEILRVAQNLSVDLLTIGGDLFNSDRDAEVLRPELREVFQGNGFPVIAILGNHDSYICSRNLDFGPDLRIAAGDHFSTYPFGEVVLVAVPYRDRPDDSLLSEIGNAVTDYETRILLLHCTLDFGFSPYDFGDEPGKSYFPITKAMLSRLGYDYVLAGHFHTQIYRMSLGEGRQFVYPGSPVSLSKKERGRRHGFLIDTEAKKAESVRLNTFYYDFLAAEVRPGRERETIKEIQKWVLDKSADDCSLEIDIKGFIETSESDFREALGDLGGKVDVHLNYREVKQVLSHPLFRRFREKLEAIPSLGEKDEVENLVLDIMSQLLAGRTLRE